MSDHDNHAASAPWIVTAEGDAKKIAVCQAALRMSKMV